MTAAETISTQAYPLTASLLTPLGRGAIATIRVTSRLNSSRIEDERHDKRPSDGQRLVKTAFSQIDSLFQAANNKPLSQQPLQAISFGKWGLSDAEELVVCRTADDTLEIHCHGGDAAVQRILCDLTSVGCQVIDWISQIAARDDLLEAECQQILSRTTTWRTTQIVLEQSCGILRQAFVRLKSLAAAGNEFAFREQVNGLLRWAPFGLHLSSPWNVVLTGRPNVGKSSLINALLGYERAIVFDQPGTTRDVVTGETAFDGWPVVLADTAGLREDAPELEAAGIALARDRLTTADVRLILLDTSQPPTQEDEDLLREWGKESSALIVAHKTDLPNRWSDRMPSGALRVSSVTGAGLPQLQQALIRCLVLDVPEPGTAIPVTHRQASLLETIANAPSVSNLEIELDRLIYG